MPFCFWVQMLFGEKRLTSVLMSVAGYARPGGWGTRPYVVHAVLFPALRGSRGCFLCTYLSSNPYVFFSANFFSAVAARLALAQPSLTT